MKEKVSFVCLNPQGVVEVPAPSGLVNPRVNDLAGKKIGIIWDGKKGGDKYCIAVEELLKERYPTATTIRLVWGDASVIVSVLVMDFVDTMGTLFGLSSRAKPFQPDVKAVKKKKKERCKRRIEVRLEIGGTQFRRAAYCGWYSCPD